MSKGLESLKFIKNVEVEIGNDLNTATKVFELNHEYDEAFEIVEKALERLETLEEDFMSLTETNMELVQKQVRNQKILNALEIIKNKRVDVELLMKTQNASDYNKYSKTSNPCFNLGQREFDFLKEIL